MPTIKYIRENVDAEVARIRLIRQTDTPQERNRMYMKKHKLKAMGEIGSPMRLKHNEARRVMRKMKWFKAGEVK